MCTKQTRPRPWPACREIERLWPTVIAHITHVDGADRGAAIRSVREQVAMSSRFAGEGTGVVAGDDSASPAGCFDEQLVATASARTVERLVADEIDRERDVIISRRAPWLSGFQRSASSHALRRRRPSTRCRRQRFESPAARRTRSRTSRRRVRRAFVPSMTSMGMTTARRTTRPNASNSVASERDTSRVEMRLPSTATYAIGQMAGSRARTVTFATTQLLSRVATAITSISAWR